jgi:hypothetical protein
MLCHVVSHCGRCCHCGPSGGCLCRQSLAASRISKLSAYAQQQWRRQQQQKQHDAHIAVNTAAAPDLPCLPQSGLARGFLNAKLASALDRNATATEVSEQQQQQQQASAAAVKTERSESSLQERLHSQQQQQPLLGVAAAYCSNSQGRTAAASCIGVVQSAGSDEEAAMPSPGVLPVGGAQQQQQQQQQEGVAAARGGGSNEAFENLQLLLTPKEMRVELMEMLQNVFYTALSGKGLQALSTEMRMAKLEETVGNITERLSDVGADSLRQQVGPDVREIGHWKKRLLSLMLQGVSDDSAAASSSSNGSSASIAAAASWGDEAAGFHLKKAALIAAIEARLGEDGERLDEMDVLRLQGGMAGSSIAASSSSSRRALSDAAGDLQELDTAAAGSQDPGLSPPPLSAAAALAQLAQRQGLFQVASDDVIDDSGTDDLLSPVPYSLAQLLPHVPLSSSDDEWKPSTVDLPGRVSGFGLERVLGFSPGKPCASEDQEQRGPAAVDADTIPNSEDGGEDEQPQWHLKDDEQESEAEAEVTGSPHAAWQARVAAAAADGSSSRRRLMLAGDGGSSSSSINGSWASTPVVFSETIEEMLQKCSINSPLGESDDDMDLHDLLLDPNGWDQLPYNESWHEDADVWQQQQQQQWDQQRGQQQHQQAAAAAATATAQGASPEGFSPIAAAAAGVAGFSSSAGVSGFSRTRMLYAAAEASPPGLTGPRQPAHTATAAGSRWNGSTAARYRQQHGQQLMPMQQLLGFKMSWQWLSQLSRSSLYAWHTLAEFWRVEDCAFTARCNRYHAVLPGTAVILCNMSWVSCHVMSVQRLLLV